jgi:hypothetical protein
MDKRNNLKNDGQTKYARIQTVKAVRKLFTTALKKSQGGVNLNALDQISKRSSENVNNYIPDSSVDFGSNNTVGSGQGQSAAKSGVNDTQFETQGKEAYGYKNLTAKPDMKVTKIYENIPLTYDGKINRSGIVARGLANIKENNNGNQNVYVADIDKTFSINANSLRHGLTHGDEATAKVTMKIGSILKNSVAINELDERKNSKMSYVLLGVASDNTSIYYIRAIVNKSNTIDDISVYKLSAVKAKQNTVVGLLPQSAEQTLTPYSASITTNSAIISIRNLLENVKQIPLIKEVLSKDAADKLGIERPKGTLSESLRHSLNENDPPMSKERRASVEKMHPNNPLRKNMELKAENEFLQKQNEILSENIKFDRDKKANKVIARRIVENDIKNENKIAEVKAYNKAKNNVISTIERMKDRFIKNKPAG